MAENLHSFESYDDYEDGSSEGSTQYATTHGYDVRATRLTQAKREAALAQSNAVLSINSPTGFKAKVRFFANEVSMTVGISGTWGQSRRIRDFYPKNLVGPMFKVTGQTLDQAEYGTLAEFVHAAQQNAITNASPIMLYIAKGGLVDPGGERRLSSIKGAHSEVLADGFIQSMSRKHERFVYAPKFTFEFVVSKSYGGLFVGPGLDQAQHRNLLDILKHPEKEQGEAIVPYNLAEFAGKKEKKKH